MHDRLLLSRRHPKIHPVEEGVYREEGVHTAGAWYSTRHAFSLPSSKSQKDTRSHYIKWQPEAGQISLNIVYNKLETRKFLTNFPPRKWETAAAGPQDGQGGAVVWSQWDLRSTLAHKIVYIIIFLSSTTSRHHPEDRRRARDRCEKPSSHQIGDLSDATAT